MGPNALQSPAGEPIPFGIQRRTLYCRVLEEDCGFVHC